MGIKVLLALTAFLATISVGTSIKCYACAGTASSDCAQGKNSSMAAQSCGRMSNSLFSQSFLNDEDFEFGDSSVMKLQAVCLQLYATDYQPKLYARGCGIFPSSVDPCKFLQKRVHVQGCKSCTSDLCNNQPGEETDPVVNVVF